MMAGGSWVFLSIASTFMCSWDRSVSSSGNPSDSSMCLPDSMAGILIEDNIIKSEALYSN